MTVNLDDILNLYRHRGQAQYGGEAVSQLDHALQCATLARQAGRSPDLIAACLLHDVGHLLHDLGEEATHRGLDDRHEYRAMPVLTNLFPDSVTEPIRLHVAAKRYLCATDPHYWDSLSFTSKQSLDLQGGRFSALDADTFIRQPYAKDAVQLRVWDDRAKVANFVTPSLDDFVPILVGCMRSSGSGLT